MTNGFCSNSPSLATSRDWTIACPFLSGRYGLMLRTSRLLWERRLGLLVLRVMENRR